VGGYSDWLRQRKTAVETTAAVGPKVAAPAAPKSLPKPRRLSYNEQRELAQLPGKIQHLEAEQAQLNALLSDPKVFQRSTQGSEALQRLQVLAEELEHAYARWDVLDKASNA